MPLKTSISCALIMFTTSAFPQNAERAVLHELDIGLSQGFPSVSMAIATRQGVIWARAVGYADLPSRSRAHPAYLYGMGSITKMLVACVIEQLVEEGRLRLETHISDLLEPAIIAGIP